MSVVTVSGEPDAFLTSEIVAHLEAQLVSARRLLGIVLKQGEAIRDRDVHAVVALTGMLQAELHGRQRIEQERSRLLDRAAVRLGVSAGAVTLTLLERLMEPAAIELARQRNAELRGLLEEIQREHHCNRVLMNQELAFLDHLLRLADGGHGVGYDAAGERPTATVSLVAGGRRVFDTQA